MNTREQSFIEGGMLENISGIEGWKNYLETMAFAGCNGDDETWYEGLCEYVVERLITAVREDERQKMYEMWRGMLP